MNVRLLIDFYEYVYKVFLQYTSATKNLLDFSSGFHCFSEYLQAKWELTIYIVANNCPFFFFLSHSIWDLSRVKCFVSLVIHAFCILNQTRVLNGGHINLVYRYLLFSHTDWMLVGYIFWLAVMIIPWFRWNYSVKSSEKSHSFRDKTMRFSSNPKRRNSGRVAKAADAWRQMAAD